MLENINLFFFKNELLFTENCNKKNVCSVLEFPRKLIQHWLCALNLTFFSLYKKKIILINVRLKIRSTWWAGNYIKWCSVIRENVQLIQWLRCGRGIWSSCYWYKRKMRLFHTSVLGTYHQALRTAHLQTPSCSFSDLFLSNKGGNIFLFLNYCYRGTITYVLTFSFPSFSKVSSSFHSVKIFALNTNLKVTLWLKHQCLEFSLLCK